ELHDAAAWAVDLGVTNGKTEARFCPGDTCTRAQITTFLWRYSGKEVSSAVFPFADVNPDTDFGKAACWTYKKGILGALGSQESEELKFNGSAPCRRKEVALYLWRLAGSPYADPSTLRFTDVEPYAEHAVAVAWAVESGITKGRTDTSFAPEDTCTRGQIVMFLHRYDKHAAEQGAA
ncbi:MAG: S-layer homology domain-containing protein, partial [Oscillibacter sp.]|nr:S-layer homology domain-containing protein [Oscillibacter sp.]